MGRFRSFEDEVSSWNLASRDRCRASGAFSCAFMMQQRRHRLHTAEVDFVGCLWGHDCHYTISMPPVLYQIQQKFWNTLRIHFWYQPCLLIWMVLTERGREFTGLTLKYCTNKLVQKFSPHPPSSLCTKQYQTCKLSFICSIVDSNLVLQQAVDCLLKHLLCAGYDTS